MVPGFQEQLLPALIKGPGGPAIHDAAGQDSNTGEC